MSCVFCAEEETEAIRTPGENHIRDSLELGRTIARMYIAAQGTNMLASDKACEAVGEANAWVKLGFNQVMTKSPYNVRA